MALARCLVSFFAVLLAVNFPISFVGNHSPMTICSPPFQHSNCAPGTCCSVTLEECARSVCGISNRFFRSVLCKSHRARHESTPNVIATCWLLAKLTDKRAKVAHTSLIVCHMTTTTTSEAAIEGVQWLFYRRANCRPRALSRLGWGERNAAKRFDRDASQQITSVAWKAVCTAKVSGANQAIEWPAAQEYRLISRYSTASRARRRANWITC